MIKHLLNILTALAVSFAAVHAAETDSSAVNPELKAGSVEITGASPTELSRLLRELPLHGGSLVNEQAIATSLERIVRHYADIGYPFCSARLTGLTPGSNGRAAIRFTVERGQFVRLGEVSIEAGRTRRAVLYRLAGIAPGDPYSERKLAHAPRRLAVSGLFRRVDSLTVSRGRSPSQADIRLKVEEFPGGRIEAAIGGGGAQGRGLAGLVSLRMNNLFGGARSAGVRWQRPGQGWQSMELSYREPWLAGFPLALRVEFSQQVRDSLFSQTGAEVRLESAHSDGFSAGLGAAYSSASPGSETWSEAESSRLLALTGRVAWSNLLRPINPYSGLLAEATGSVGRRRVNGDTRREIRATVRGEAYIPLGSSAHVAALRGGTSLVGRGQNTPADIPWHARIPVGGTLAGGASVRGHTEESTRASRALWMSLEYRLLTGEFSRLFVFYDMAAALVADTRSTDWRTNSYHGLGGGIQADTRLGLLEIALAVDPRRGPGDGRLHIRMAESF
jgi:outer membrane protein assembly factor BamA